MSYLYIPHLKATLFISLLFIILFFNSGCGEFASMNSHSKISRFQNAENVYRASMRWGEWNELFHLMKNKPVMKDKPDSLTQLEPPSDDYLLYLDTIKVRSVSILSSKMNEKSGTGSSQLKIGYRFDNGLKIHSIRHTINWWYHKESNLWFTNTPLPKAFLPPELKTIRLSP